MKKDETAVDNRDLHASDRDDGTTECGRSSPVSGYRPVRVAEDESLHYAGTDAARTIGCARAVVAEVMPTGDGTGGTGDAAGDRVEPDRERCGACLVEWMGATGQIRLIRRRVHYL